MKKLFILFAICMVASTGIFAQASALTSCHTPGVTSITPGTGTTPGLKPSDSTLPCSVVGMPVSDTIYFTNYTSFTVSGLQATIGTLTIDSIYMPTGLCWQTNKANNTFGPGENGVIYVSGVTHDSAGQYKLRIIVDATVTSPAPLSLHNLNAESYAGLAYRVRVIGQGCPCPPINNNSGADSAAIFLPYACQNTGVNDLSSEVSGMSVVPNPFTSTAKVSFNSEIEGAFTVKMVNLLGAVVSSKEVSVSRGSNEFSVERNGLSAGIYIMSMTNGSSSVSRKVIIE
jgi:hypothetical protein